MNVELSIWPNFKKEAKKCNVSINSHKTFFNNSLEPLFDLTDENCGGLRINVGVNNADILVDFWKGEGWKSYVFSVKL